jgi:hypothetical protein
MKKHTLWLILKLRNKLLGINKEELKMILIGLICTSYQIVLTDMAGEEIINLTNGRRTTTTRQH